MAFFLALSFAPSVNAGSISSTITQVHNSSANKILITLAQTPTNGPSCATNSQYQFAFDPTTDLGKSQLSLVLTAYAMGAEVNVGGNNVCSQVADVENMRWIRLL